MSRCEYLEPLAYRSRLTGSLQVGWCLLMFPFIPRTEHFAGRCRYQLMDKREGLWVKRHGSKGKAESEV